MQDTKEEKKKFNLFDTLGFKVLLCLIEVLLVIQKVSLSNNRVKGFEFNSCISSSEVPVNRGMG